jgi:hypothetical protein
MNDIAPDATPDRPSIALTTPFLSLAAAVIALAAFLLGYVVKDIAFDHGGPRVTVARMDGPAQFGPDGKHGMPALPERGLDDVTAGTVTSVDGNILSLKTRDGRSVKVTLDKDVFVVVHKAKR